MKQGYLIVAYNNNNIDYLRCAQVLAKSIKRTGDLRPICLLTTDDVDISTLTSFDFVKFLPTNHSSNDNTFNNDWQVYELSPFEQTLKIESDVFVTKSLDNWWTIFDTRDMLIATGAKTFKQKWATSRYYRQTIDKNMLPDVYNGLTYFRKSIIAEKFYSIVRNIFENWTEINNSLSYPSILKFPDTDTVYALASVIVGVESTTMPNSIGWVHMKPKINTMLSENWTKEMIWELTDNDFRINTYSQLSPVHYVVKEFAKILDELL